METNLRELKNLKVALVHDWLIQMRGGEKVLESLAELFPEAVIYTLFYNREKLSPALRRMKIRSSFLQRIPGIQNIYRWLLPILPAVAESLHVEEADLVISSSHCVAKGVKIPNWAIHICYCHTPMRYLWGYEKEYFGSMAAPLRFLARLFLKSLKKWDLRSNQRVHFFIANSANVQNRIQNFYGRDSFVIYPPLDTRNYKCPDRKPEGEEYYLVVSAFVPYKRVDLALSAFNSLDRRLLIAGGGPTARLYKKLRKSGKISFLGGLPDPELQKLYAGAKALIFPTEEDFGIVPLEAQACGTPVIAFAKGGALESVKTGVFFHEQTPEALRQAVLEFEQKSFSRDKIASLMTPFSKECFKKHLSAFIAASLSGTHAAR